jgi:methionine sulfoxide reductase heme-binding subunit
MAGLTIAMIMALPKASSRALVAAATTPGPTLWYVTRATAVAAYITLSMSVILGLLRAIAGAAREHLSWVVDELHAFIATLAGVLVFAHVLAIALDPYIPFTLRNLLVPGQQPYRPLGVNLGVLALYAMVVLLVTSWLRPRFPYRLWRPLHALSFFAFALVTIHGILAGSDAAEPWMRAIYTGAGCAVAVLLLFRLVPDTARAKQ